MNLETPSDIATRLTRLAAQAGYPADDIALHLLERAIEHEEEYRHEVERIGRSPERSHTDPGELASRTDELERLAAVFERLGARDPRAWAKSQVSEGIPQLARFLFLRQAWREVVKDRDVEWIPEQQRQSLKGQAGAAIGPALTRLLKSGAEPQDISTVVRVMQWQLLTRLCYLLSAPGICEPDLSHIGWSLFLVDEDGQPIDVIGLLHESVLDTDPSGREMGSD